MTMKFANADRARDWYENIFLVAVRIVAGDHYVWDDKGNYNKAPTGRAWFKREHSKYRLHPAVEHMMRIYRPDMWQQMLLEWPHKSETDPNRLAYTRDERAGEADRQVVTTIGKYLRRHFPEASDDLIRDIVAQHTYGGDIYLTQDPDEMVRSVIKGPRSCMSKPFNITCDDGEQRHPYAVYDPECGWSMAVRKSGEEILGRCLVYQDDDDKCFVRSYKRERDELSASGADEAIEMWLKSQGYEKRSSWPDGTPIREYRLRNGGWLMPYIDGGTQEVDESDFTISYNGDIQANNTDGTANAYSHTCEDCGEGEHEDAVTYVGYNEDRCVCHNCIDNYTYAYGRRGREYYVPDNEAVYVDGEYYDQDYLSDNGIVELHDGDYCHQDNAVYIDSEDAYYHVDSGDICYAEDSNQYELIDNCWRCEESGNWYTDDEDYVEIDGCKYHPDHAPEQDEEDDDIEVVSVQRETHPGNI